MNIKFKQAGVKPRGSVNGQTINGGTVTGTDLTLVDNVVDGNSITITEAIEAYDHISSTGESHTYIDQDITIGSSPTFDGSNFTGIPDSGLDETYLLLDGRSGGQIAYGGTDANDELKLYSTSNATKGTINLADILYVDETDNKVGIGTTDPKLPLHVYTNSSDVAGSLQRLEQDGAGDVGTHYVLTGDASASIGIDNSDDNKFKISGGSDLGSTNWFTIDTGGKVGIGTTNPTKTLEVSSGTENVNSLFTSSDATVKFSFMDDTTTANTSVGIGAEGDVLKIWSDDAFQGSFGTNGTLNLLNGQIEIDGTGDSYIMGKVGIGTTGPDDLLDVSGTLRITNDANNTKYITLDRNGPQALLQVHGTNSDFQINSSGSVDLHIESDDGKVGIGTNDPDTILDVNGAVTRRELSANPADPDEGSHCIWQSDGTGDGDDGDILVKVTANGTTKTTTLVDFSAI